MSKDSGLVYRSPLSSHMWKADWSTHCLLLGSSGTDAVACPAWTTGPHRGSGAGRLHEDESNQAHLHNSRGGRPRPLHPARCVPRTEFSMNALMSPAGIRFTSSAPSSSAESDLVQHWDLTRRRYQSWEGGRWVTACSGRGFQGLLRHWKHAAPPCPRPEDWQPLDGTRRPVAVTSGLAVLPKPQSHFTGLSSNLLHCLDTPAPSPAHLMNSQRSFHSAPH